MSVESSSVLAPPPSSSGPGLLRFDPQRSQNQPVKRTRLTPVVTRPRLLKVTRTLEAPPPISGYYVRKNGTMFYKSNDGTISERGTVTQEMH